MSDPLRHLVIPSHPLSTEYLSVLEITHKRDFWDIFRLRARGHLGLYRRTSESDRTAEILTTFLDKLPEQEGQIVLIREIQFLARHDRPKLKQLKDYLVATLLNPFVVAGEADCVRRRRETEQDNPSDPQLRADCLRRDGDRCQVTGTRSQVVEGFIPAAAVRPYEPTEETACGYSIPFALGTSTQNDAQEVAQREAIWFAIHRYFPSLKRKIGPDSISQPRNVTTMTVEFLNRFDRFNTALRPMGPRTYAVHTYPPSPGPDSVMFCHAANSTVPRPDPEFFEVRWIIAEILAETRLGRELRAML